MARISDERRDAQAARTKGNKWKRTENHVQKKSTFYRSQCNRYFDVDENTKRNMHNFSVIPGNCFR